MNKFRKLIIRTCLVVVILIPISGFAHFIIFPQETRSMLVNFSDLERDGRLYFNAVTPKNKIDSLKSLIEEATIRIDSFWGQKTSNPKYIYCYNQMDFTKYSVNPGAPAVSYLKFGAVIVLSAGALDVDIIAHEMSHAEFYERIGFFAFNFKVPSWFKHGLAMQNDYRRQYSEDTLMLQTDNLKNMPDIKTLKSDKQFYSGTLRQVKLNYMAAAYEVRNWYSKKKLDKLVDGLNSGKSFEEAYGQ